MERVIFLAALAAVGCKGGDVEVRGQVPAGEQPSTNLQGQAPGGDADRARVSRVEEDGSTTVLAEGEVAADGSFVATVPRGEEKLVVEAVDASGQVVASGLLETSGDADVVLPALDAESSLEALVYVDLVASGSASLAEADPCDLRARIDSAVAGSVSSAAQIHDLAVRIAAAQSARTQAWGRAGVSATSEDAFHAELTAAAHLDAALVAGADVADAERDYFADLGQAAASLGVSAARHAEATSQATLALGIGAEGKLGDATLRVAARAEAEATGAAALAATDTAADAVDALHASVDAAASADEAADGFAAFQADLVGDGKVQGSVLDHALGLGVAGSVTAELAVDASLAAADTLDATIAATGSVDADAGRAAVDAWATYRDAVGVAVDALPGDDDVAATLVVCATGSFRIGR